MNKILSKEVSFDLAKLLKEKGYNERPYYIKSDTDYIEGYDWDIEDEEDSLKIREFQFEDARCSHLYLKPTISDVVDWIFEKHGIWIYSFSIAPFVSEDDDYPKMVFISKIQKFKEFDFFINSDNGLAINHFISPLEAYEEAIKYVLSKY